MHQAHTFLTQHLSKVLPEMDARRVNALMTCVTAPLKSDGGTAAQIGRHIDRDIDEKHRITVSFKIVG